MYVKRAPRITREQKLAITIRMVCMRGRSFVFEALDMLRSNKATASEVNRHKDAARTISCPEFCAEKGSWPSHLNMRFSFPKNRPDLLSILWHATIYLRQTGTPLCTRPIRVSYLGGNRSEIVGKPQIIGDRLSSNKAPHHTVVDNVNHHIR